MIEGGVAPLARIIVTIVTWPVAVWVVVVVSSVLSKKAFRHPLRNLDESERFRLALVGFERIAAFFRLPPGRCEFGRGRGLIQGVHGLNELPPKAVRESCDFRGRRAGKIGDHFVCARAIRPLRSRLVFAPALDSFDDFRRESARLAALAFVRGIFEPSIAR